MYVVLGIVAAIYLVISITNRSRSRKRKSRKFMDGYSRKTKKEDE